MELLIGIDMGTSGCKVIAIDSQGTVVSSGTYDYGIHYPRPGWAEQNPEEWYQAACQAIQICLGSADLNPREIIGLSVTGPAHNVALLDDYNQVLCPTIHWSDLRSEPQTEKLGKQYGHRIFEITYQRVNPSWTLSQLLWLKENLPYKWANLRRILVTKDYVRHRLIGDYQTDVYDAIGTQIYNIDQNCWSTDICKILDFDIDWLPTVSSARALAGKLSSDAARDTGLISGTPVAVGSGDSVIEALGSGVVEPGQCILKLGTAGNVNLVTARSYPSPRVLTYRHIIDDYWFHVAATNSGAITMRWFRDALCHKEVIEAEAKGINVYKLIDQLAEVSPAGSEGLVFHPYLMGERSPYWDPRLRGDFVGISARHRLHHFARAVLEGVSFSLRNCLEEIQKLGQTITEFRVLGGGAKSPLWRQTLCTIVGMPLIIPKVKDASYGAALLAGVAVGIFTDWENAVSRCVEIEETLQPDMNQHKMYNQYFDVYRAISRDLAVHSHRLVELACTKST